MTLTNVDAAAVNTLTWLSTADAALVVPVYQRQYRWDSTAAAEVREDDTCVLVTPGDRVTYIALNPGNTTDTSDDVVLYDFDDGGWKVDESTYSVNIASIDFLSIGGGGFYDFGGAETTRLGVLYGQAVEGFTADDLGGVISAAEYPFEGTARVQQVG